MTTEKTELELFLEEQRLTFLFEHWYEQAIGDDKHDSIWGRASIAAFVALTTAPHEELVFVMLMISVRRALAQRLT